MSPITMQSSVDNDPAVAAALGDLAKGEVKPESTEAKEATETEVEAKSVEADESATQDEAQEESEDASHKEDEAEELEAKNENESESEDQKPKKKSGFQRRVDKLNQKLSAKDQEIEHWKAEALKVQNSTKRAPAVETQSDPSEPRAEEFETHQAYLKAVARYEIKQELKAEKEQSNKEKIQSEAKTKVQKHIERVEKFSQNKEDWDEVLEAVNDIVMPLAVQESIVESDMGPELMYELAKNPSELKRICSLGVIAAARELGKLEAKLIKPANSSEKKLTSKAPTPVTPVRTKGAQSVKSAYDADKMSQAEWDKMRAEQEKARRASY